MSFRAERINSEMQKSLTDIIRNRLRNPKITEMVSVTKVNVAKDLKTAKVHVSIYGDKDKKDATFQGLVESAGFIRRELSVDFKALRTVPEITFLIDDSFEYSQKIDELIEGIKKNDAKK